MLEPQSGCEARDEHQRAHALDGEFRQVLFVDASFQFGDVGVLLNLNPKNKSIADLVPADITIRRNLVSKPLEWRGSKWQVKNAFELKNARRVLVEGNVFEHVWAGAQTGYAIVFTPRNQGGRAPYGFGVVELPEGIRVALDLRLRRHHRGVPT